MGFRVPFSVDIDWNFILVKRSSKSDLCVGSYERLKLARAGSPSIRKTKKSANMTYRDVFAHWVGVGYQGNSVTQPTSMKYKVNLVPR